MRPPVKILKMKIKYIRSLIFYIAAYSTRNLTMPASELALFLTHVLGTILEEGDMVFDSCMYMVCTVGAVTMVS